MSTAFCRLHRGNCAALMISQAPAGLLPPPFRWNARLGVSAKFDHQLSIRPILKGQSFLSQPYKLLLNNTQRTISTLSLLRTNHNAFGSKQGDARQNSLISRFVLDPCRATILHVSVISIGVADAGSGLALRFGYLYRRVGIGPGLKSCCAYLREDLYGR